MFNIFSFLSLLWVQLEALIHPFFDELRDSDTRLPNGRFLPPLFNFKPHGESLGRDNNDPSSNFLVIIFYNLIYLFALFLNQS